MSDIGSNYCTAIIVYGSQQAGLHVFPTNFLEDFQVEVRQENDTRLISMIDVLDHLCDPRQAEEYGYYIACWYEFIHHALTKTQNRNRDTSGHRAKKFTCMGGDVIHCTYILPVQP